MGSIFITSRNYNVDIKFLPLLEDFNEINSYAWGAAVLANLHKFLKDFKNTNSTTFSGAAYILMFFILERIPKLRNIVLRSKPFELPSSVPLMCQWIQIFSSVAKSTSNVPTISKYQEELLNLPETEIIWWPYNRLKLNELPLYVWEQRHLGRCMTMVVCFNEAGNHRPDYAPMQFGLEDVDHGESTSPRKTLGRQPIFKSYITSWEKRLENMIGQMPNEAVLVDMERGPTAPNEVGSMNQQVLPMNQHAHIERDAELTDEATFTDQFANSEIDKFHSPMIDNASRRASTQMETGRSPNILKYKQRGKVGPFYSLRDNINPPLRLGHL